MKVQNVAKMPTIQEQNQGWDVESQEARRDGSWHNSDAALNTLQAARLERCLKNAGPSINRQIEPAAQLPQQTSPATCFKKVKNAAYIGSMICGIGILPSFAMLTLGPLGLLAPAALFVLFVALGAVAGKPTESIQAWIAARRVDGATFDPRGMT